jgi:succinoglycan biosynthesis transport protein ExoP
MSLQGYLAILWFRKWVIVITATVTMVVVIIGTWLTTPTYTATTTLRVATSYAGSTSTFIENYVDRLMNTYIKLATSRPVITELEQRLGINYRPHIDAQVIANTELIKITVESPDPNLAANAANTLIEILMTQVAAPNAASIKTTALNEQLAQIESELNDAQKEYDSLVANSPDDSERLTGLKKTIELEQGIYETLLQQREQALLLDAIQAKTISVVEPAIVPQTPTKPRVALNMALGSLLGLFGGVGLAFLFENLDTTLYSTEQIEKVTQLPSLGAIPIFKGQKQLVLADSNSQFREVFRRLRNNILLLMGAIPILKGQKQLVLADSNSQSGEAFRRLRNNILLLNKGTHCLTLLVTSSEPKEGKSTIVANLAISLAQSGKKVIVVDCDMHLPTQYKFFSLPNSTGLSNFLLNKIDLDTIVQDCATRSLWVITTGTIPYNPTELISSPEMSKLLGKLRQRFDVVLLDTSAIMSEADAAILAPIVDEAILVVRRGRSRREDVQAACKLLVDAHASSIGVVINRSKLNSRYGYYDKQESQVSIRKSTGVSKPNIVDNNNGESMPVRVKKSKT